jgi:hypothetical protein
MMGEMERRDTIRRRWADLLEPHARADHPLYAALCDTAQSEGPLVDLLLDAPDAQQRPNLLLAAIHAEVLRDPHSALIPWYPTAQRLHGVNGNDEASLSDGIVAIVEFCEAAKHRLGSVIRTRSTQTNEVGRSLPLAVGLTLIGSSRGQLALVDLGCSGGLNLIPDRYRLEFDGRVYGDPSSPVTVQTIHRGSLPAPASEPLEIMYRCGIEVAPLDLDDDDDVIWALACQWPDDVERFERTRAAINLWREQGDRPTIVPGDLLDRLGDALDAISPDLHIVVHHSWVAAYLNDDEQRRLAEMIRRRGAERPLSWLWLEHPKEVPGLDPPRVDSRRIPGSSLLVLEDPPGRSKALAQVHPHGSWMALEV